MKLRRANKDDYKDIIDISKDIWEGTDYIPQVFHKWVNDKEGEFTVAEFDGKVIGCAKFTVLRPYEYWLEGIRTHKDYRGMGIGDKITKYYINKGKDLNYNLISLSTYIDNKSSISIIENNGFNKDVSFKGFYFEDKIQIDNTFEYEVVNNVEDILHILDSKEMKVRSSYLSFDWTFVKADRKLLGELVLEGSVYVLREGKDIKSTVILSDKMSKNKELSLSYIDGSKYYIEGIKFAISKYNEGEYNGFNFMCPFIDKMISAGEKAGLKPFGEHKLDVFVYQYDNNK